MRRKLIRNGLGGAALIAALAYSARRLAGGTSWEVAEVV